MTQPTDRVELAEAMARGTGAKPGQPVWFPAVLVAYKILDAIEAAGLRVVPVELTEEMHAAFSAESDSECPCVRLYEKSAADMKDYIKWARDVAAQDHAIMLAAAPFNKEQA